MKRLLCTLVTLLALVSFTRSEVFTHETVPSPKVYGQNFYVANPDSVVTSPMTTSRRKDELLSNNNNY